MPFELPGCLSLDSYYAFKWREGEKNGRQRGWGEKEKRLEREFIQNLGETEIKMNYNGSNVTFSAAITALLYSRTVTVNTTVILLLKSLFDLLSLHLSRWALSSWSTCASWSSPPSSPRQSKGRTPWWGNSVHATCPMTPRSPVTVNQARATRRCCATSVTFIES